MWTVFGRFLTSPTLWTILPFATPKLSLLAHSHECMGQNSENIPRWFYVSFPNVFYNISGRRRTAKCNSSVSTDDHEDDFLTLEIHQEHCDQIESQSWHEEASVFGRAYTATLYAHLCCCQVVWQIRLLGINHTWTAWSLLSEHQCRVTDNKIVISQSPKI